MPHSAGMATLPFSCGEISSTAISFSRDWDWNDNLCRIIFEYQEADVRIVAVHEAGHMVSLDHDSSDPQAAMWPDGRCKLVTYDDDLGVIDIYGESWGCPRTGTSSPADAIQIAKLARLWEPSSTVWADTRGAPPSVGRGFSVLLCLA